MVLSEQDIASIRVGDAKTKVQGNTVILCDSHFEYNETFEICNTYIYIPGDRLGNFMAFARTWLAEYK